MRLGAGLLAGILMVTGTTGALARALPSLNPAPPADSRTAFLKLMRSPTILILREFRRVCLNSSTQIDFDKDQDVFDKLKELQKRPDPVKIRGLVYSAEKCTTGKSKESVIEFLGVDMLINQSRLLVRALAEEQADNGIIESIAKAEPDEIAGIDCSKPECKEKKREAFTKKKAALETLTIRKDEEGVRQTLLTAVRSIALD